MLKDGLWDVYNNYAMGMCAELCADHHLITREEQVILRHLPIPYLVVQHFCSLHNIYAFSCEQNQVFGKIVTLSMCLDLQGTVYKSCIC